MDEQIHWLQGKGLLARQKQCPGCSQQMVLQTRNDVSDKDNCYASKMIHVCINSV